MLRLLSVTNFATIEHLEVELTSGFNVLTGETGAGKSIIVDALSLLMGGRADGSMVRSGTRQSQVEGVFQLGDVLARRIEEELAEYGVNCNEGELILAREVNLEGRNLCRVNGRIVPLKVLVQLGERLVDIHGQTQHLSLYRVGEHLDILDRYGNLGEFLAEVADRVTHWRETRRQLDRLKTREQETAQQLDFLQYQCQEIDDANLQPGEDEELTRQYARISNAEKLVDLLDHTYRLLYQGEDANSSVIDLLGQAGRSLAQLEQLDPSLAPDRELGEAAACQVDELARSLRGCRDSIEFSPERLLAIEDRLHLIKNLKRKYGATLEDIQQFAERAHQDLDQLSHSEERAEELQARSEELRSRVGELAGRLSQARQVAAQGLAVAIEGQVAELAMARTQVRVSIRQTKSDQGVPVAVRAPNPANDDLSGGVPRFACDATGIDQVEFLISPNPGEPLQPLAKIASGGEASRLMLAIKVILSAEDQIPTLIFDEVDTGVGGRIGRVLGEKLGSLSPDHQVLCVTHLPQLACYADHHVKVTKASTANKTVTSVEALSDEARLLELSQMLGSDSVATRRSAAEMLQQARQWQNNRAAPSGDSLSPEIDADGPSQESLTEFLAALSG